MKTAALLVLLALASTPAAEPRYFTDVRAVTIADGSRQNYLAVDEDIWKRSRPDLGDVRLFDPGGKEWPYALRVQRAARAATSTPARLLQLGSTGGRATFFLDLEGLEEYDRVTLDLDRKDFVATATVEGRDELTGESTRLGEYTLYDFSREDLGRSTVLKLPRSRFRYLRIGMSAPVRPQDVRGATVANLQERTPSWTEHQAKPAIEQSGKTTVIRWDASDKVPLDRVELQVPPETFNFCREVTVKDAAERMVASGEICRVRLRRGGKTVESEQLAVEVPGARSSRFTVIIQNGDDPPLQLLAVRPQATERRLYFDPRGQAEGQLYYGDPRLEPPVYDYAKLFQEDPNALRAALGPGARNPAYTPRPDDRPWTERHPLVLWSALVLAVLGLGLVALRGLKT